ncbi:MAG: 4-hydroxyphenylacetate decarboxylase activase [Betaproteobacteria bacterium]
MTEPRGLVFDIQGYSVHDGPGCRTLVFLSGCPLRCQWCANPEGLERRPALLFRAAKCRRKVYDCSRCVQACPKGAIAPAGPEALLTIDREACWSCETFECTKACAHEALAAAGRWLSVSELMRIINRDRQYWGDTGGVTFTGGEPLLQREFILAMLKRCHEAYVQTAVETSACVETEHFLEAMQHVDWAFADLKHMDLRRHQEKTGVTNGLILHNIRALAESGWPGRLILRIPIIEGFNDTEENLAATADFMERLGRFEVNILPFHRMGDSKWTQLGKEYPYRDQPPTADERMRQIQQFFLDRGLACYVGSYTPF